MVKIKYQNNYFYISFSGDNFYELLDICKNYKLKSYKEDSQFYWITNNKNKMSKLLKLFDDMELVICDPNRETIINATKIKLEVKNILLKYNSECEIKPPLNEHQKEAIKKLIYYNRFLLSLDTGTGKTYCMITALNHLIYEKLIDKIFIVSFRSTLYNWKKELLQFSNYFKDNEIFILNKDIRNFFDLEEKNRAKVIITDYVTFRLISDYYYKKHNPKSVVKNYRKTFIPFADWGNNRCIILDECQKIKGYKSAITKKLNLVKHFFEYRYCLSATPAPNKLPSNNREEKVVTNIEELHSIFNFLDSNIIGLDNADLKNYYCNIGNRFSDYAINYVYYDKYIELLKKLNKFILKKNFNEIFPNIPPQIKKPIYIELNNKHKEIYEEITRGIIYKLSEEKGEINYRYLKNRFMDSNLICSDPSLVNLEIKYAPKLENLLSKWSFKDNSKLSICDDLINQIIDDKKEKCIIWTYHPYTADKLKEHYKKYNPIIYNGTTKIPKNMSKAEYINNLIFDFKKNSKLAIISPLCLGVGINLEFCKNAIFFDLNYNAEKYLQALGRIRRATSLEKTFIYILLLDNTFDIIVYNALILKTGLIKNFGKEEALNINDIKKFLTGQINYGNIKEDCECKREIS